MDVLVKRDKVKWFEQLLVEEPSDEQLDYVDDVFSKYLEILTMEKGIKMEKEVRQLCKAVLKVEIIRPLKSMSKFRLCWR